MIYILFIIFLAFNIFYIKASKDKNGALDMSLIGFSVGASFIMVLEKLINL